VRRLGAPRRLWVGWIALLLAFVLVGLLAPTGQGRPARERSPEEETLATSRKASEKEERAAAKKAQREQERSASRAKTPKEKKVVLEKSPGGKFNGEVRFACTEVNWTFKNFPNKPNNTVTQELTFNHERPKRTHSTFSFNGPTGSTTTLINGRAGHYMIDAWARWRTNGVRGNFDLRGNVTCKPKPAFSIKKLQEIAGGGGSYTEAPLRGHVGQTVDYEIVVKNTGNVPLTLGDFSDPHCDAGTISGGPGSGALALEAETTYFCTHLLDEADQSAGSYSNTATVTGTPPVGEGSPVTETSNAVIVKVAKPGFSIEKLQEIVGAGGSFTTAPLRGQVGQTVDYEIVVTNTGNVPLTLGDFSDPHCDAGTISGGPGSGALEPEAETTYSCTHLLDEADQSAGSYSNTATVTGSPPEGEGSPVTHTSNTVIVGMPGPAFSIEKLQEIAGGGGSFTTAPLSARVGQIVNYEIVVTNTGNVRLSLGDFSDPHCDDGSISGGLGSGALEPGATTVYLCDHVLTEADRSAGSYANTVTLTGTPRQGNGPTITNTSNTVVTTVTAGSTPGTTPPGNTPASANGPSTSKLPLSGSLSSQSGVLAFGSTTVPSLRGPQGCVRPSISVKLKSAGVASATFYLDGHRLKTLTAHNAHRGQLTLVLNAAKLSVGAHKLMAKITMAKTASSARVTRATRTITLLRCRSAVLTPKFTG